MEQSNTIVEYKSQFDALTSNFLKTYMNLETTFSQMKCDLSNQLLKSHQTNEKLTEIVSQKKKELQTLQGKVLELEKKELRLINLHYPKKPQKISLILYGDRQKK